MTGRPVHRAGAARPDHAADAARPVHRTDRTRLINRISRIEGQMRGIRGMIEEDRYCIDVLTQIQAVRGALARLEGELLKGHLAHCVEAAIVAGDPEEQRRKAAELVELLERRG